VLTADASYTSDSLKAKDIATDILCDMNHESLLSNLKRKVSSTASSTNTEGKKITKQTEVRDTTPHEVTPSVERFQFDCHSDDLLHGLRLYLLVRTI